MAITTGGELARVVREGGGTVLAYTYPSQPRAALGWLYGLLIGAFSRLGLIDDQSSDVQEAIDLLKKGREALGAQQPAALNPAKRTAGQLIGRLPVIWGAGLLAPVARRWQTQINEQAKALAYSDVLPELDHNTVAALGFPETLLRQLAVIDLVSPQHDHPRVAIRHEATRDLLLHAGVMVDLIEARGRSRLAQQMSMIQLGDYASYYLAMAYGVDPTPIESIQQLKDRLAQVG
jgi:glucose/mannose-6-phosphate isomerase